MDGDLGKQQTLSLCKAGSTTRVQLLVCGRIVAHNNQKTSWSETGMPCPHSKGSLPKKEQSVLDSKANVSNTVQLSRKWSRQST